MSKLDDTTHYEGCWADHIECAGARITLLYEQLACARENIAKKDAALDGLLAWAAKTHKKDGWNSLTTPGPVVAAFAALILYESKP